MNLARHVSHYFEKDAGPFLSICDLDSDARAKLIEREKDAKTGFNRYSIGKDFFDFRHLADNLIIELYEQKFGAKPVRRPYYGVLGDADVVGGLYRNPHKVKIPVEVFSHRELTFMCPDHFHLVSLMNKGGDKKMFGYQIPADYSESKYPYFGKLLTYQELSEQFHQLKLDQFLEKSRSENNWYRYIEAQIWAAPEALRKKFTDSVKVTPEPWTHNGVTHLQNYNSVA